MEYRKLGQSDLELSIITFGAWAAGGWMWGSTDRREAIKAMQAGISEGVTSIDTAPIYGQGTSEELVGEAIKDISRDKVQILTKFASRWDTEKGVFIKKSVDNEGKEFDFRRYAGRDGIIYECEQSLKRLGTDYIDLYQIHWDDPSTPIEESYETVAQLIKEGKVRYAGVCNYNVEQMKRAQSVCDLVSNQVPFSMVNRGIEEELLPFCIKENKSILAYSPMERGLLTGKMKAGQVFPEGDHRAENPFFTDESITRTNAFLEKLRPIAEKYQATLGQVVLRWTVQHPGITIALAGARNAEQSIANAKAGSFQLPDEDHDFITKEIEQLR